MEVNILAYNDKIILDEIYEYINNNGLFIDIISKIKHLEENDGRGTGQNYKSLKNFIGTNKGINICEIKSNGPDKELLRIFYYSKYNQLILILDWMSKPENYTKKKEKNDVNKEYAQKIDKCILIVNDFYNNKLQEDKDYINFNKYLASINF